LTVTDVEIELDDEEVALLSSYEHARLYRGDLGATLRDVFFSWWEQRFVTSPNGAPTIARTESTEH